MDLIGTIVEGIKLIAEPAIELLKYHRNFNEYVDSFERVQAELHDGKADIQQKLQEELHFGTKRKREVENWSRKVDETIIQAQDVEEKIRRGKYLRRSFLGKLVDETTQAMKEVYVEGHFSGSLVVDDPATTKVKLPTTELAGMTAITEEIFEYLMGDEVRKIGVCGMGGIGKTTIMKHVHNKLLEGTKFSKLIWTTVSQDFEIRRLQNNIACQLNEKLSDDEDTTMRAAKLSEMLQKQGSSVVILDDAWESFSLGNVGIPEPTEDNGCKLVLTTRSEQVVRSMGCEKVQVLCLPMDEAMQLFLSTVGQEMLPNPTLEAIMEDIVGECGGLPLAIVTVAGSMKGISDPRVWKNALNELRGCIRNLLDMEEKVFGFLKFSYNLLGRKDQDCFLYCALYPEDREIQKEEIIECWMDQGLIDVMETREAMEGSGHSILQKLEENCLLERAEEGTHIKMHDVVRDMALNITRGRFLVKAGKKLEELPDKEEWGEDLEKVSLMRNSISKVPPNLQSPKCQKLTTLLLSHNSLEEIPESFFGHMPNLKILDLSKNPVRSLPNSISSLENLTALLLCDCDKLENVPSLSKLQGLKKLNLRRTGIKKIPQGLEMLVNLRYLNLGYTFELEEIHDGILSKLYRLQHLILHPAPSTAEEIRTLKKLEVFDGCFTGLHGLSMYAGQRKRPNKYFIWMSHNLSNHWFYNEVMYFNRDYTKMVSFWGFNMNTEDPIILPFDIRQLYLDQFEGGGSSLNDIFGLKDVTSLKECTIESCSGVESIFSSCCASLQTLEVLHLVSLWNLKAIFGESVALTPGTFSSLKVISLDRCGKLKNLFSAKCVMQDLHNLEEIRVSLCVVMEEIISSEKEGTNLDSNIIYTLPKLRKLELYELPALKGICKTNVVLSCDSLQEIEISHCPKLKRIPLYFQLDNGQPTPPPPLKEICLDNKEWWESVEWDDPNAKNLLLPLVKFWSSRNNRWEQAVK